MKILLDVMGGDHAPKATVEGAVMAAREYKHEMVLIGDEQRIKKVLKDIGAEKEPNISVVHAASEISMEDSADCIMYDKNDSSMAVAMKMLAAGEGDAVVSAGNTGAFLAGGLFIVKRIKGVKRAALSPILPTAKGGAVLIDCGANAECTPDFLYQFAYMGSVYAEKYLGMKSPRVALINNGAEETKGTPTYVETHKMLKDAGARGEINFIGNAEGRDVPLGMCDVVVADGFTGNVLLKTTEGVAMFFAAQLKGIFMKNLKSKLAALMVKSSIDEFKKSMDYTEVGGAPLLGVNGVCIKAHGSSNPKSFKSAIGQAIRYKNSGVIEAITEKFGK